MDVLIRPIIAFLSVYKSFYGAVVILHISDVLCIKLPAALGAYVCRKSFTNRLRMLRGTKTLIQIPLLHRFSPRMDKRFKANINRSNNRFSRFIGQL